MNDIGRLVTGDHRDPREEVGDIFGGDGISSAEAETAAVEWAEGVLRSEGIAPSDELRAIKALRGAEPKLGLKTATYLAGVVSH